ncbi:HD domain-containing protein [Telmatocola sphagniphila]|uniref:HD domain-containing protein n=1 Tax=Telmatocola sphagniphila TaxID=1123043 RepID=A0A8E6ETH8_9BACT|nr:HD domain-containing protein [Telmatocola sphagniphila]QVL30115.1 HD domain-containing protein [Telmatocola sphagniphila]
MHDCVNEIFELFANRGQKLYFGEEISEEAHALQAAYQAEKAGESDAVVVAALLHDIGHLLHGMSENIADQGIDGKHEDAGEEWLKSYLGPEVTEPVRLHVEAKRYLCAIDPRYQAALSPASQLSLQLQGGPLNAEERAKFEENPYYRSAVKVRGYDDQAKIVGLEVPTIEHYREKIEGLLRPICA